MPAVIPKGRTWDLIGLGTITVLGILGVRRRNEAGGPADLGPMTPVPELEVAGAHCIVTGASSGIGAEVAWGLARAGAGRTEMACRDLGRCERARAGLLERCLSSFAPPEQGGDDAKAASARAGHRRQCAEVHQTCVCRKLELTDVTSVRAFADRVSKPVPSGQTLGRVVLVNNAGVLGGASAVDGVEDVGSDNQLWSNHYGHFLLTRLLLPVMGPGSAIVVVASRAHRQAILRIQGEEGEFRSDDIDREQGVSGGLGGLLPSLGLSWYARYARSKLCNVLFAAEIRRRYPDGPCCVAVSPGLVDTGLFAGAPLALREPLGTVARRFFQSPEQGGQHVLAGVAVALAWHRGEDLPPMYWHEGQPQEPSAAAAHPGLSAALWRASSAVVGI